MLKTAAAWLSSCATTSGSNGSTTSGFEDNPYHALARKYLGGRACSLMTFGVRGGYRGRGRILQRAETDQAVGQSWRREIVGVSSGLDDASADVRRRAAQGGRHPEMIRLSIGIEHADDITADLDQALANAK